MIAWADLYSVVGVCLTFNVWGIMAKKWMVVVVALLATMVAAFLLLLFLPKNNTGLERILVKKGDSVSTLSRQLEEKGLIYNRPFLVLSSSVLGRSQVRPGQYRLPAKVSTWDILQKLAGNPDSLFVRIPEGSTFAEMRAIINQLPHLEHTTQGLSTQALMKEIDPNQGEQNPEGLFFPDTYEYTPGMSDLALFQLSYKKLNGLLQDAWDNRQSDLPYKTPYELLIMASIIEKETGHPNDRAHVAAVFINRLKVGMRLQTDPTVIYGMGSSYAGKIRRSDLRRATPYNTYVIDGLPPTPISLPSEAAIEAAAHPSAEKYLYFVSKMDSTGESYFSHDLKEHNDAVNKYIRKR